MKKKDKLKGFTFIEVIVTLVVVGILAAASVPLVRHLLAETRIKAAAENFVQYVQLARSEAIARQQNIYLILQTGGSWCYGLHTANNCSCSPTNTCTLGAVIGTNYPGVTISSTGFTSGNIYFDSSRGLPNEASTISFLINTESITVRISRLGQVAICGTNISGYPTC